MKTLFIERVSPWENGYIESFKGKIRDELLNQEVFTTLEKPKVLIEQWRVLTELDLHRLNEYNKACRHSARNYRSQTPEFLLTVETR